MSNYPPGVSAGSPRAPWNDPPAPECPDCCETIHDVQDHADWCDWQATVEEIREYHTEERREYDPLEHGESR